MYRDIEKIGKEVRSFIDQLCRDYDFDKFLECRSYDTYWDFMQKFNEDPLDMEVHHGATRIVFIPDDADYVIKIQYSDFDIDYCASEAYVYSEANRLGLSKYFAWTEKAIDYTVNGHTVGIYVMDRCDADSDRNSDDSMRYHFRIWCEENDIDADRATSDDYSDFYNSDRSNYDSQDGMLAYAAEIWGGKAADEVEAFFEEYHINDCHCGNYGYIGDNLVIIDYCGYKVDVKNRRRADE